jgi:hypothetical protein
MRATHPLFDVLALFTIDERDVAEWSWQPAFLRCYLGHVTGGARLNPQSKQFRRAYRGLLAFFLVYRLNEARINAAGGRYFDGLPKGQFVWRKAAALILDRGGRAVTSDASAELDARVRNVRRLLTASAFREHLRAMRAFEILS